MLAINFVLVMMAFCRVRAEKEPAQFYLDTRTSSRSPTPESVDTYPFKNNLPLKFIIHGWTEDANRTHYINMGQVFLETMDCYVIRVDYSALAAQNYIASVNSVGEVGKYVGDFLIKITKQFNIPMSSVHVIGHSLGGQVSGYVGRRVIEITGQKVHRISALDPAAPLFENNPDSMRLSKKDAEFVDVIHTDGGVLGCARPLGHLDFFPNGGRRWQPGCHSSDSNNIYDRFTAYMNDFYCSHHKSYHYFTASLMKDYIAKKCNSWEEFQNGVCDQNERITFGARAPETANGTYFLEMDIDDDYVQDVLLIHNDVVRKLFY